MSFTASRRVTVLPALVLSTLALAACQDATAPTARPSTPAATLLGESTLASATAPADTSVTGSIAPRLLDAPPPPTGAPLSGADSTSTRSGTLTPSAAPSRAVTTQYSGHTGHTSVGQASCASANGSMAFVNGRSVTVGKLQTSLPTTLGVHTVARVQVFLYRYYTDGSWRYVTQEIRDVTLNLNLGMVDVGSVGFTHLPAGFYRVKVAYSWWTYGPTLVGSKLVDLNSINDYAAPDAFSGSSTRGPGWCSVS